MIDVATATGWKQFLLEIKDGIDRHRVLAIAAGVAFYGLLAVFPAIAALVSLYGLFTDPAGISGHLDQLAYILPGGALEVIREQMMRVATQGRGTLSFAFVLALALSLWSANAGMKALFDALNVVYEEPERRGFLRLNAVTLGFTFCALLLVLLAIGGVVLLPLALNFLGLARATELLVSVLRWPAMLAFVGVAIAVVYRFGPSRHAREVRWRWITWGSAFASLGWFAVSFCFSWYAANFGSYNKTYGSLGAVIGFMTWLWLSTVVLLVGAELDAALERRASAR